MKLIIKFLPIIMLSACTSPPQTTKCTLNSQIPEYGAKFSYQNHEYQYVKKSVNWTEAKKLSEESGGYLAVLETEEELGYVLSMRKKRNTFWVGLTDYENEGEWVWLNGEPLNSRMEGFLERGRDLPDRDFAHLLLQGDLMSRHVSGGLPASWRGQMCVSGYLVEFDSEA